MEFLGINLSKTQLPGVDTLLDTIGGDLDKPILYKHSRGRLAHLVTRTAAYLPQMWLNLFSGLVNILFCKATHVLAIIVAVKSGRCLMAFPTSVSFTPSRWCPSQFTTWTNQLLHRRSSRNGSVETSTQSPLHQESLVNQNDFGCLKVSMVTP